MIFGLSLSARGKWAESVLFEITDPEHQGSFDSPLADDDERDLYGCSAEAPTFELTPGSPQWNFNPIWQSPCGSDVGLILDRAGDLYGYVGLGAYGEGAISELSPGASGLTLTELYSFCSKPSCPDGDSPLAPFSWDSKGNLYGTTYSGGAECDCGVAFQLTHNTDGTWAYHVMHRFSGRSDGCYPYGSLTLDADDNAYGASACGPTTYGVVFRLTETKRNHWEETVLYDFGNRENGFSPMNDLVFDKAGNLYGTASSLNCNGTCGLVFKLSPQKNGKWKYSVLHRFSMADGNYPNGLTMDGEGNLFGTTTGGGKYGYGVVFELTP